VEGMTIPRMSGREDLPQDEWKKDSPPQDEWKGRPPLHRMSVDMHPPPF